MKIMLPVQDTLTIYKDNPHTAPRFAVYNIDNIDDKIHFSLHSIIENPIYNFKNEGFTEDEKQCNCKKELQANIMHRCEHYSLLESINDCTYLLAKKYCKNTQNSMKKAGIKVYKIPPIINKIDIAIKNFLIGASLVPTIQNTYNAS